MHSSTMMLLNLLYEFKNQLKTTKACTACSIAWAENAASDEGFVVLSVHECIEDEQR